MCIVAICRALCLALILIYLYLLNLLLIIWDVFLWVIEHADFFWDFVDDMVLNVYPQWLLRLF